MDLTRDQFLEQFPRIVLGARELPRKTLPYQVVLVSAVAGFEPGRSYAEAEVNRELQAWVLRFGSGFGLDHASLRRLLVDEGYLERDSGGEAYVVQARGRAHSFDPSIRALDFEALVAEERSRRESRKQRFVGKSSG